MDYEKLEAERTTDPLERGHVGMTNAEFAARMSVVDRSVNVESVTGQELFEAVAATDYGNLNEAEMALLYCLVGMGTILVNGANTKAALLSMFGPDTDTRSNLAGLQTRLVSRAEELELGSSVICEGHVENARM